MAAHADDLRYWYSETIGDTIELAILGASARFGDDEPLTPGRYVLRIIDFGTRTDVWIRQGKAGDVEAAATTPSMRFRAHTVVPDLNLPIFTFIVRPGSKGGADGADDDDIDALAIIGVAGADGVAQLTKYSRDLR